MFSFFLLNGFATFSNSGYASIQGWLRFLIVYVGDGAHEWISEIPIACNLWPDSARRMGQTHVLRSIAVFETFDGNMSFSVLNQKVVAPFFSAKAIVNILAVSNAR